MLLADRAQARRAALLNDLSKRANWVPALSALLGVVLSKRAGWVPAVSALLGVVLVVVALAMIWAPLAFLGAGSALLYVGWVTQ
jgi:hypothetical protein